MELIAGLAMGALAGFLCGLYAADKLRNREPAVTRSELLTALTAHAAPKWNPQALPYQPPVIVLAAPRAQAEPCSTAVTRR